MSKSYALMFDEDISHLYRLEKLAKEYKAAYERQDGSDAEWEDRLEKARKALFEELEK